VTEADWNSCTDPQAMLTFLRESSKLSERKARLFAVACCRGIWDLMTDGRSRVAVMVAERFADGLTIEKWLEAARGEAHRVLRSVESEAEEAAAWASLWVTDSPAGLAAGKVAAWAAEAQLSIKRANKEYGRLVRDLSGLAAFRTVTLPTSVRTWNNGLIQRLAEAAYEHRLLPSGHLDPERLAVLADALEDAGADGELVEHLRGPGPHVRGCWPVDWCLGKS
jgi:hypothetical protein